MDQPENNPGLVHNRAVAVVALCLTGFVAALSFRGLFSSAQHKSYWLLDLRLILPIRAAAINVGFYAYLLWLGVVFYRAARGKERILVAGWFVAILLGPVQILVPMFGAVIGYLKVAGMMAAFLAAVYILINVPARGNPRLDNQASRNT
jgi:hypothetical protein